MRASTINCTALLYGILFFFNPMSAPITQIQAQHTCKSINSVKYVLDSFDRSTKFNTMTKVLLNLRSGAVSNKMKQTNTYKAKKSRKKNPFHSIIQFLKPTKSAQQLYIETLEQTIETIQNQIRTMREESRQLRTLLTKQQSHSRSGMSKQLLSIQSSEKILLEQIQQFEKQIKEMEESKAQLMEQLEMEREKVAQQEEIIREQKENIQKAELQFKQEMEIMRTTLLKESKLQMEQMALSTDQRMQADAIQKQKEMEILIEKERNKGLEAVENEKRKMRKLVKALAEREKRGKMEDWRDAKKLERQLNSSGSGTRKKIYSTAGASKVSAKKSTFGAKGVRKS